MNPRGGGTPEEQARIEIDRNLEAAGWLIQDRVEMNLFAGPGVAVREFALSKGHGFADYLLFVDGKAVGVLEAKPAGHTLSGVEPQAEKYADGLPAGLNPPVEPLPFMYLSTGAITKFTNLLDPRPRSRPIFQIHRPATLAEWLQADTLDSWVKALHAEGTGFHTAAEDTQPSTLRARLQTIPPLEPGFLYPNQIRGVENLEQSLKDDRPRSLIQMATGSGKTMMAISSIYRLIKIAGARRVLFLVDRGNLAEQAEKEFQGFRSPDDNRKFTELYNVQRLTSNTIGDSSKVVITTIQRFYSMLKGDPELAPGAEEESSFCGAVDSTFREPLPVVYNSAYPPEYFDVIFVDECHRSIYSLWRQVLEYFDAYIVGLTATPAQHTFGFFHRNLVMEYPHEEAVADGVNVDFEVYKIRTKITESGATIEAENGAMIGYRSRDTRQTRWEQPDENITYDASDLDRRVVSKDQIRLIIRTFKEKLFTEIFPGRTEVPKTIIFAKDDSHAEDIVGIIREEFNQGNSFCRKITYKVTGRAPSDLIQEFRNSYEPRIAVTVDMIATGTDIKPVEIVMFMRSVKSRILFEQMKGRGVRIIGSDELKSVTSDARAKTHFVIVDCVGVTESELNYSSPLERKKSVAFKTLLEHVAMGGTDPDVLSSLASRLSRLNRQCGPEETNQIETASGGVSLPAISGAIIQALDPDAQIERARLDGGLGHDETPTVVQVARAAEALAKQAVAPLATRPEFRQILQDVKKQLDQIIDEITADELIEAGASEEAREKARQLVGSFEKFLEDNKDQIAALEFFYSVPHRNRLRYADIKALAESIKAPPRSWTPEQLWRAYEMLDKDKVRGASGLRLLTDVVSLVRFALHQEDELAPYGEKVHERFGHWMVQQKSRGRDFSEEQVLWLEMIRDHVATSLEIDSEDFDYAPFAEEGGLGRAHQVFGKELGELLMELNEVLVA